MMPENQIICGAMPEATKVFPDGHFNCCISSPPYWSLRDYGLPPSIWDGDINCEHKWDGEIIQRQRGAVSGRTAQTGTHKKGIQGTHTHNGQFCSKCGAWRGSLGLEPTFELFIKHLCDIYDEVKRVLRDDGTCWVNLGDTYGNSGYNTHKSRNTKLDKPPAGWTNREQGRMATKGIPDKSLCLIPQRFAIEMVNRGWILRNVIIWHKPNPMPSSAKDRFTCDFEYVYFFVKSKKYWFEPQYEPYLTESNAERPRMGQGKNTKYNQKRGESKNLRARKKTHTMHELRTEGIELRHFSPLGRNKRTVWKLKRSEWRQYCNQLWENMERSGALWTIPTQSFPDAHFATYPEKLVEPMIKAGCPEFVCTKCGKAREKIIGATGGTIGQDWNQHNIEHPNGRDPNKTQKVISAASNGTYKKVFKGYTDCGCKGRKEYRPGRVLDCFLWFWDDFTGSRKAAA